LEAAEQAGWSIGLHPTFGLACLGISPDDVRASLSAAEDDAAQEDDEEEN
jgi:hypothetical protein